MNKIKFEQYLREHLSVLQHSEIDEIVQEYLQHIDLKVLEGVSEEEAIKQFGDLNELIDEILAAYKINPQEQSFNRFESKVKFYLNKVMNYINDLASSFLNMNAREIINLVIQFVVLLVLLAIVNDIIGNIFSRIEYTFYFSPHLITGIIRFIIRLVSIVLTSSLSLIVLYWFAQERIIKIYFNEERAPQTNTKSTDPEYSDTKKSEQKTYAAQDPIHKQAIHKEKNTGFDRQLYNVVLFIAKVMVWCLLIPLIVLNVIFLNGYIYLIYATLNDFGSVGLILIGTGVGLLSFSLMLSLIKFVGGKKDEK
ncbi:MAG: hypothetical protein GX760_01105 [Erysipelothrix sp.]|nr:hypothetical protein [Erysipelothrix sp.]